MGQILFGVVMKAGFWLMILASSLYILVALTLGLLISSVTKSQMVANQMAVLITYLPSLLLSNFVFPVINMPKILQIVTWIVPATYYIDILAGHLPERPRILPSLARSCGPDGDVRHPGGTELSSS